MRLRRHVQFPGLLMVLLALWAQLAFGSVVPHQDPISATAVFCHADAAKGGPEHAPLPHAVDCLLCPFCVTLHVSTPVMPDRVVVPPSVAHIILRPELPPPSTAPPQLRGFISQSRAPPFVS